MLASENWCVKVDERIYGPYTSEQMRKYAHEGRLAAWSMIAPAGSRNFRKANAEPAFASFFGGDRNAENGEKAGRAFGKRDQREEKADGEATATTLANFVIVFDTSEGAANRLQSVINGLGAAFRISDNVWALSCDSTATGVRNAIAPYLTTREGVFVVDASRGRT